MLETIELIKAAGHDYIGTNNAGIWYDTTDGSTHLIPRGWKRESVVKKLAGHK